MRALSTDPGDRFSSAAEFGSALRRALGRRRKRGRRLAIGALVGLALLVPVLWGPGKSVVYRIYGKRIIKAQNAIVPVDIADGPVGTISRDTQHNYLGICLTADDALVVAGAPCASETLPTSGSGYAMVYRPRGSQAAGDFTLEQVAVLESPRREEADRFGFAVANHGETIVCGAWGSRDERGAVFVSEPNGPDSWAISQELQAPADDEVERYGFRIAIDGDTLAVSTPGAGKDIGGRVFVYERESGRAFELKTTLRPENLPLGSRFGRSVALHGDTLVVGCYGYGDRSAPRRGCAYVYSREAGGEFELSQQLVPKRSRRNDYYGSAAEVVGHWLVVSSWKSDFYASDAGAAVVFKKTFGRWRERQHLVGGDHAAPDGTFANSPHIRDGRLLCGAPGALDESGTRMGQVFVYSDAGTHWQPEQIFQRRAHVRFGSHLAVCRGMLVAGGMRYDGWRGSVWIHPLR